MAEVSIICKRTVISTKPVQPGKFINLSVLDRVMELNHLRSVFYYQFPSGKKSGELTEKLRESISEMLSDFPLVIGRLLRSPEGYWIIKCNDAGLRMVEAKAKGTVKEWLQNLDKEKELKLIHWEEMFHKPYYWSPFYVQITEFENGGLAIGLSCTHLLSDPTTATMIIKAWADTTLGSKIVTPPLFQTLPSRIKGNSNINHQPYFQLINHYKSSMQNPAPISKNTHKRTITLLFNQEMVRSCIAMAEINQKKLTPFEALSALLWTRISKVKGMKGSLINLSITLDTRKVLGLDNGFFGNCTVYNNVGGDGLDENELSKAAFAIKEVVSKMDSDGVMDLIEWLEQEKYESPPLMNGYDLVCVNIENVDSYSAIFEDGVTPVHVSYYIEPSVGAGQVLVLPSSRNEGEFGRVVMVTLPEDEAEKLLDDELIQHFTPTILMGFSKKHF